MVNRTIQSVRTPSHEASPAVAAVLAALASLTFDDLTARVSITGMDEPTRLVAEAVNSLAARMEVSREETKTEAHLRDAEFDQIQNDIWRLSEFLNLLQACEDSTEAFDVIEHEVGLLFPGLAGMLYMFNNSRNLLELKTAWGGLQADTALARSHCWALRRGRPHLVLADSAPLSCKHTQQRWGDSICYPMSAQGETLGMLHLMGRSLQRPGQVLLTQGKQRLGSTMSEQIALSLANLRMRDSLGQQALRDSLTGLYNRRFLDECFLREVNMAEQRGSSLGVLMIDLDHFKRYNDVHGHDAGDTVLAAVAHAIGTAVREVDVPCRYGGEEFLVLLPDVDAGALMSRAEEIRSAIASTTVRHNGAALPPVAASIGASAYPDHARRPIDLLRLADAALYTAEERGRNCAVRAVPQAEA